MLFITYASLSIGRLGGVASRRLAAVATTGVLPWRRWSGLILMGLAGLVLPGCGTPPRVATTNFTVFTPLHLKAVELATSGASNQLETTAHMQRFFGSTPPEYTANELRMDRMLERSQVATAARQARVSEWLLDFVAGRSGVGAGQRGKGPLTEGEGEGGSGSTGRQQPRPGGEAEVDIAPASEAEETESAAPPGSTPGQAKAPQPPASMEAAFLSALGRLNEQELVDSPFDTLDRVSDFYAAYALKYLRGQGDSRAVDTRLMEELFVRQVARPMGIPSPTNHPGYRLLTLVLQTQVDTGNRANLMAAVRIGLTDEDGRPVPILRLHPTRTYDIDSTLFADEAHGRFGLTGTGQASPEMSLSITRNSRSEEQTLKRFYSRVGKVTSYADASQGIFGWTFHPANLRLLRTSLAESAYRWLVGTPAGLKVRGFVEGGGRDSFVVILVPWEARRLQARVSTKHAKMKPDGSGYELFTRWSDHDWSRTFDIPLPQPSLWEPLAATPGLARFRVGSPATQDPVAPPADP